jgi:hypothetical protein
MSKTIIHIGLHKTATTYLQENVWPTLTDFTLLSRPFTQHNHAFNQLQYADDSLYDPELLTAILKQIPSQNLLLSDESFSGKPLSFSYLNRSMIANRLYQHFPNAEIILFLRDQKDIIKSHYNSYIKMPYGVKKIDDFIYKAKKDFSYSDYLKQPNKYEMSSLYYNTNDTFLHLDCFKYTCLIELYKKLFNKCHIFLYEDFKADQAAVIHRLEDIVEQRIKPKGFEVKNQSLSAISIERRRQANQLNYSITNRYMRKLIQGFMACRPVSKLDDLNSQIGEVVSDHYVADNIKLKKLLPSLNWAEHSDKYC